LGYYSALAPETLDALAAEESVTSSTRCSGPGPARARTGPLKLASHSGTVPVFVKRNLHLTIHPHSRACALTRMLSLPVCTSCLEFGLSRKLKIPERGVPKPLLSPPFGAFLPDLLICEYTLSEARWIKAIQSLANPLTKLSHVAPRGFGCAFERTRGSLPAAPRS
jgi:hypothetical protein